MQRVLLVFLLANVFVGNAFAQTVGTTAGASVYFSAPFAASNALTFKSNSLDVPKSGTDYHSSWEWGMNIRYHASKRLATDVSVSFGSLGTPRQWHEDSFHRRFHSPTPDPDPNFAESNKTNTLQMRITESVNLNTWLTLRGGLDVFWVYTNSSVEEKDSGRKSTSTTGSNYVGPFLGFDVQREIRGVTLSTGADLAGLRQRGSLSIGFRDNGDAEMRTLTDFERSTRAKQVSWHATMRAAGPELLSMAVSYTYQTYITPDGGFMFPDAINPPYSSKLARHGLRVTFTVNSLKKK